MSNVVDISILIFLVILLVTFGISYLGRVHSQDINNKQTQPVYKENLNKWLIGLSAGATANSGFIVTGAVGLGYMYGIQWIFLPLAWLIGDLFFWKFFPHKINEVARESKSSTIVEMLLYGINKKHAYFASILISIIIIFSLGGYLSAQWLAGQKILSTTFPELSPMLSLLIFTAIVVSYSVIGGFRGSVYADSFQAILGIIGTTLALVLLLIHIQNDYSGFVENISTVDRSFLSILPGSTLLSTLGFFLGFAAAALGFGLGQPQVVSRYMAGKSAQETSSSKWIYIFFVQYTWLSMTIFGVLLRGVIPEIKDAETGLIIFISQNYDGVISGLILATIFAIVASTTNSILITLGQIMTNDLTPIRHQKLISLTGCILFISVITLLFSLFFQPNSVFDLAISSLSMLGSGLGASMIVLLLKWKRSGLSLILTIILGSLIAFTWKSLGYNSYMNEAFIGISSGIVINLLTTWFEDKKRN